MNFKFKFSKSTLLVIALFGLLTLLFFFKPIFLNSNLLFVSDLQVDFVTQFFAANSVRNNIIPLWDPYYYGPFLAYYNSAVFYPLNILMYFLFPLNNLQASFNIFIYIVILHYFLAAVFMYLLMKKLGVSKFASVLSAVSYAFSGFMIGQMVHVQMIYSAAFVPLLFFFLVKALKESSFWIVYAGLTLGIMFFAGHPQPTIYYCFIVLILCVYESMKSWNKSKSFKSLLKPLNLYFICAFIAFGLTAIQMLPFFEFIPYSFRSQTNYKEMFSLGSITPTHLISLIFPGFFGGEKSAYWGIRYEGLGMHETNYYTGIYVLILLVFLFFCAPALKKKYNYLNFFIATCLVSFFLMLGRHTILSAWFYLVPGLNKMRIASRLGSVFNFSCAILVGYSLDVLIKEPDLFKKVFRQLRNFIWIILFIAIAWLVIFLKYIYFNHDKIQACKQLLLSATNSIARFVALFIIFVILLFSYLRVNKLIFKNLLMGCFILFAVVDIFSHQIDFYPKAAFPQYPEKILIEGNSEIPTKLNILDLPLMILKDKDIFRIRMPELYDMGRYASINKIFSLGYGGAVAIARLSRFRNEFENPQPMYNIIDPRSSLLDYYNVKYFYSKHKLDELSDKYKNIEGNQNWYINDLALPRAICVNKYFVEPDEENVLKRMKEIDLNKCVILSEEPKLKYSNIKLNSNCKIENYSNNEIKISVTGDNSCFIVLSEVWFPGWKAYIDGKLTKIYRANYTFRAIEVSEGEHSIRFVYDPFSFKLGALVSLIVALLTIFLIALLRFKAKR